MLHKIEQLRKKPKHVRDRYAFWFAFLFTVCVAGVWATTLPARFLALSETEVTAPEEIGVAGERWSGLLASVRSGFAALGTETDDVEGAVVLPVTATTTSTSTDPLADMVWTEAAKAPEREPTQPARTILIGTTSTATASGTDNVLQ